MSRDEIIRMAREVGILDFRDDDNSEYVKDVLDDLERFASLVAAAEREAAQRAFWEACRPHWKVGEVVYTTYKHLNARGAP